MDIDMAQLIGEAIADDVDNYAIRPGLRGPSIFVSKGGRTWTIKVIEQRASQKPRADCYTVEVLRDEGWVTIGSYSEEHVAIRCAQIAADDDATKWRVLPPTKGTQHGSEDD